MPVNYIDNEDMLTEVRKSKEQGKITDALAKMFILLVHRFALQRSWSDYTLRDDWEADALVQLCRVWDRFDETISSNPFSFYTQCVTFSFNNQWRKLKRRQAGQDRLRVLSGFTPSYGYQIDNAMQSQC